MVVLAHCSRPLSTGIVALTCLADEEIPPGEAFLIIGYVLEKLASSSCWFPRGGMRLRFSDVPFSTCCVSCREIIALNHFCSMWPILRVWACMGWFSESLQTRNKGWQSCPHSLLVVTRYAISPQFLFLLHPVAQWMSSGEADIQPWNDIPVTSCCWHSQTLQSVSFLGLGKEIPLRWGSKELLFPSLAMAPNNLFQQVPFSYYRAW